VVRVRRSRAETLQIRIDGVEAVRIVRYFYQHPVLEVVLLLLQRLGLVGDRTTFDDAHAARLRAPGAHDVVVWPGIGIMRLNVPVGRVNRLPNSVQIRLAVLRAGALCGRRGTWLRRRLTCRSR